jgi:hypothetical protein
MSRRIGGLGLDGSAERHRERGDVEERDKEPGVKCGRKFEETGGTFRAVVFISSKTSVTTPEMTISLFRFMVKFLKVSAVTRAPAIRERS